MPPHPWFLYSALVMGGRAQDPEASSPLPLTLDAILAVRQSTVPGIIVAGGSHPVCLIKLVGSKKFMHVLSSCPMAFKARVLANSI